MAFEIKVPSVGESITEVQIGEWYVEEGQWVDADENIVGLETDKATFDVPAPAAGIVTQMLKQVGETAAIGDVIGYLEEAEKPAEQDAGGKKQPAEKASAEKAGQQRAAEQKPATRDDRSGREQKQERPSPQSQEQRVMPAAARLAAEKGIDVSRVSGTGPGGRVLKEDVAQHREKPSHTPRPSEDGERAERTVPMTPIRRRIAERLVEAQQTAALLTTFNEIDMTNVKKLRAKYGEAFREKYDVKLGFMSFFVKAVVEALAEFPAVGAQIRDGELVYFNYADIGIAVGGGKGLVVPVLRNAQRLSLAEIESAINDLGRRAAENKITLEELEGGCFTISNGGVYGSLLSTPIVNPPQSGVLGMHAIQDRPVVVNGEIAVRPMMYVALTYDHRVVDGREAVTFLRKIKDVVEDPTRIILEV